MLAVDSVLRLKGSGNLDYIKIIKKAGGTLGDSYLADGFILQKKIATGCDKAKTNPKIMVANTQMDADKVKILGSKVKVDSVMKVAEIEEAEKAKMKRKVEKILAYKPDVFINRQLIYNYPEQLLADNGVMVSSTPTSMVWKDFLLSLVPKSCLLSMPQTAMFLDPALKLRRS